MTEPDHTFGAGAAPWPAPPAGDRPSPRGGPAPGILQVLPRLEGGGVERGAVDLAIALKEAGWRPVVASAGGAMVRLLDRHRIPHVVLPLQSKNPFAMRANVGRLRRVIRSHAIDIVHARSRAPAWSAEAAARRTGARFVTTFHGTYGAGGILKRRYNAVMTRGERVIAISDFIARHIAATYAVDPARLRTIRRGVDVALFNPGNVSQERMIQLANQWNLPDDRQVILMPGRFSRRKGHELLIDALAALPRRDLLCIMTGADTGSRDYVGALEARARQREVLELVRFVDFSRDLSAAYMLADLVVSASLRPEAFGRTLAEALAMGRPVVGPGHGGAPEITRDGRLGWLFRPGDAESLAEALDGALALNTGARVRFADEAMRWIRGEFTNERMCARTMDVYAEVLTPGAAAEAPAA